MARSELKDAKGPLARALGAIAREGPASVLGPLWAEVVGQALAGHSRPVRLCDAVLTVVAEAQFTGDLERERPLLCQRLNARLGRGAVRQILVLREGTAP